MIDLPNNRPVLPACRNRVRRSKGEDGYILITLLLFVALLAIAAALAVPEIKTQMKRDREQELIHRGVQYSRAIQHYVKKFGHYPSKLEDLENTNQVRFLRKRYKDPITGKDFRLLHMGEVQVAFGGGIAGATSVANLAGGNPGGPGGFPGPGGLNTPGGGILSPAGGLNGAAGNPQGLAAANPNGTLSPNPQQQQQAPGTTGSSDSDQSAGGSNSNPATGSPNQPGTTPGATGNGPSTDANGNQVFGGAPVVGVASTGEEKSIRVFNKKDHYNQWQFIYDPSMDRGGLLQGPYQTPQIQNTVTSVPGQGIPTGGTAVAPGGLGGPANGIQPNSPNGQPGGLQTPQMPPEQ